MPKQDRKRKTPRGKRSQDWEALPPLNQNAAGIDVGNAEHYVAVPAGRDAEPVQTFGSFTADLHRMARWLKACGIQTVAMQATGVYWVALYQILEQIGSERGQRASHQDAAWQENRRLGMPVVTKAVYLWAAQQFLPTTRRDLGLANLHAATGEVSGGR